MYGYGTGSSCINDNVKFCSNSNNSNNNSNNNSSNNSNNNSSNNNSNSNSNSNNKKNQLLIHAFRNADCVCIVITSVLFADLDHVCELHIQRMLVDGNISVLPYKKNNTVQNWQTSITKRSEMMIIMHWFLVTQECSVSCRPVKQAITATVCRCLGCI